jgi:tetratricopeptide (TPR) repeat protein
MAGCDAAAAGASIVAGYACDDCEALVTWLARLPPARTLVIAGIVILAVALAALGGWAWWEVQQRRQVAAAAEVLARVPAAQAPDATTEARLAAMRDLEGLLQRYPSARTVPIAAYELGNLRFAAGEYAAARAAYEISLQRGASGVLGAMARAAVARTWEAERNFGRAAEAYGALSAQVAPRSFMYEDALVDQARTLELAGKKDEAIAAYQRVLKELPAARRADDVRSRLASLGIAAR